MLASRRLRLIEKRRELCLGAFAAAGVGQHDQVKEGGGQHRALGVMRSGRISSTITSSRGVIHRGTASAQDRDTPVVVPVVQDALEDVDVATGRDRREEVALDELATIGHALLGEVRLRELEHSGPFQQDAGDLRTVSQDLRHQGSRSTSDIDEGPRAAQDVGSGELASHGQGSSHHAGRCAGLRLRVRRVVLEQRGAVDAVECRLAGADGVQQLAERAIHLLAEVDHDVAHAAGCAARSAAAASLDAKRPSSSSQKTPAATSARRTRRSCDARTPTASAIASASSGCGSSTSATPSFAATYNACESW